MVKHILSNNELNLIYLQAKTNSALFVVNNNTEKSAINLDTPKDKRNEVRMQQG